MGRLISDDRTQLLALPLALIATLALSSIGIFSAVFRLLIGTFLHELGHAYCFWLFGRPAIPTHIFFTVVLSYDFSWLVFALTLFSAALLLRWATSHKVVELKIFAGATIVAILLCSTAFDQRTAILIGTVGGLAGEFVISAFLIILFHSPLPPGTLLHRARWVLLLIGTKGLLDACHQWYRISRGIEELPMGSFLFGSDHGDLNTLIEKYAFQTDQIIDLYLTIGIISVTLVLSHFAFRALYMLPREDDSRGSQTMRNQL